MDNGISNNTQRKAVINSLLLKPQIMFFFSKKNRLKARICYEGKVFKTGLACQKSRGEGEDCRFSQTKQRRFCVYYCHIMWIGSKYDRIRFRVWKRPCLVKG